MAEKRICLKCKSPSWSANTTNIMKCPYCGAGVPPPKKVIRSRTFAGYC